MPADLITTDNYVVQSGDTLFAISRRANIPQNDILAWNNLSDAQLREGQRLRLTAPPQAARARSAQVAQATAPPSTDSSRVDVRPTAEMLNIPNAPTKTVDNLAWRWPVQGRVIQRFQPADPMRKGVKISGREGELIRTASAGTVAYSGNGLVGYGELIIIKHNNNYLSAYAYNSRRLVNEGDTVKAGAAIAEMGLQAGRPLLHFEIRRNGDPVNPMSYLP
jgi:lipoprotein NlpD